MLLMFIVSVTSFNAAWASDEIIGEDLSVREINPKVFIVTHAFPWPSNSLVAVMETGDIVLIDTPYTSQATEVLLGWISNKFGRRNIQAINTHFHIDRLGGNAALVKAAIPVYGSDMTVTAIQERGQQSLQQLAGWVKDEKVKSEYLNFKYVAPTKIFKASEGLALKFGSEEIMAKYHGGGHSVDNLVVYLPQKRIIFGGCLILSQEKDNPGNVSDGNLAEWESTLSQGQYIRL
jgi:metallo-beta-lactamase class B